MSKPLKITNDTSVEAKLRILPEGKDELTVSTGWLRLGDLIELLLRLRNGTAQDIR